METSEKQNAIAGALRDGGWQPTVDDDRVVFKHEGKTYAVNLGERDDFIQLSLPNIWRIETVQERRDACEAAERATARTKVGKVHLNVERTNVWVTFEMIGSVEAFTAVLPRALAIIRTAVLAFVEHIASCRASRGSIARA